MNSFSAKLFSFVYQSLKGSTIQSSPAYNPEKIEIIAQTITINIIMVAALLLIAITVFKKKRAWFTKIVLVLTFIELFLFSKGNIITMPFEVLTNNHETSNWLSTNLQNSRYLSTSGNIPYTGLGVYWTHLRAREPFSPNKLTEKELKNFPRLKKEIGALSENQGMKYRITDVSGYAAIVLKDYKNFWEEEPISPNAVSINNLNDQRLDILGVKYLVTGHPRDYVENIESDKYQLVQDISNLKIYENMNVRPRSFLQDGDQVQNAKIINYQPNEVIIQTPYLEDSAQLVLTDNLYPGWVAMIDGERANIEKYKNTFRMLTLPPGEHLVRFVFQPSSIMIGAIISSLALFIIATQLLWQRRK